MMARFSPAKFKVSDSAKCLLAAIFIALVFLPLARMFSHMDAQSIRSVVRAPIFGQAVANSFISASLGTVVSVVLAFILAFCVQRTRVRFKGAWNIIFTLPMLIPSISIGMGLVILLGNNGILTHLFRMSGSIYGLTGIVLGSVMYAFPVAYLMLSDVFHYEDATPYEAAKVLGIPKFRQFTAITLPYLRKPLISVVFATFTLIVTDYGIPLMVGGKFTTIASVMYQEVIGQLDFGKGAVYGTLLLIPAIISFIIDLLNKDKGNAAYVNRPIAPSGRRGTTAFSYLCCGAVTLCTLLPIVAFVLLVFTSDYPSLSFTLENIRKAFDLRAGKYFVNSLIIALCSASIGTGIAFSTAYMSVRMKSPASRFLHLSSMASAAIPGVVLGLSYVLSFKQTPMYGTIAILVMVNIVHFIASPYLMMYNSLSKINENLEGVAQTLGIGRLYMIRDVFIPQCRNTLIEMFSYFFVNCMMTISAVSFLANTSNKPVSLMINQFEAQMQLECAAVVSLMILAANILLKALAHLCKNRHGGK